MLRVTDLDRSIKFYTEALGMTLIRTRDNPENKYKLAFLGGTPCSLSLILAPSIITCSAFAYFMVYGIVALRLLLSQWIAFLLLKLNPD